MTRIFAAVVAALTALVLAVTAPALPALARGSGPPSAAAPAGVPADLVADDVSFRGGGGLVLHG
ncbi:alpha/beta hydrolase, partial [Nonomuraea terrae]